MSGGGYNTDLFPSSLLFMGLRNSGLEDRQAAIETAGERHLNIVPRIRILLKRRSKGSMAYFTYIRM